MSSFRKHAYLAATGWMRFTSQDVKKAVQILEKGAGASRHQIQGMRDESFRELVQHCYQNVPFYKNLMDEYGIIPGSIHSLHDLKRFPVLTKETVRTAGTNLRAVNIDDTDCTYRRSGGTTGEPIGTYVDKMSHALETYSFFRGLEWMGWRPGMTIVRLLGGSLGVPHRHNLRERLQDYVLGHVELPAFELSQSNTGKYLDVIRQAGKCILVGYSSALYLLAAYANKLGLSLKGLQIETICPTSVHLEDEWAKRIQETFQCPVRGYYGCAEINSLGYQVESFGPYLIPDEHVVIEVADPNTCAGGTIPENSLLLTSLFNKAQPWIRYLNGDLGELAPAGELHPTRNCLRKLIGRSSDMFVSETGALIPGNLGSKAVMVTRLPLFRYQFIQTAPDRVEFHYEAEGEITLAQLNQLADILRSHLGMKLRVESKETTDFIYSKGDKFRVVISQIPMAGVETKN